MPVRLSSENEDRYIDLLYEPIRNDGVRSREFSLAAMT